MVGELGVWLVAVRFGKRESTSSGPQSLRLGPAVVRVRNVQKVISIRVPEIVGFNELGVRKNCRPLCTGPGYGIRFLLQSFSRNDRLNRSTYHYNRPIRLIESTLRALHYYNR